MPLNKEHPSQCAGILSYNSFRLPVGWQHVTNGCTPVDSFTPRSIHVMSTKKTGKNCQRLTVLIHLPMGLINLG